MRSRTTRSRSTSWTRARVTAFGDLGRGFPRPGSPDARMGRVGGRHAGGYRLGREDGVSNLRDLVVRWLRPPVRKSAFQVCLESGRATLGPGSYGEPEVYIFPEDSSTQLRIGAYSSIAAGTRIVLGGEHHIDWVTTSPLRILNGLPGAGKDGHPLSKGDITIANDVWIGMGAMILSGVTIGNGAVVGAGAVVARDVPPFAVVAGNPASNIRFRFPPKYEKPSNGSHGGTGPTSRCLARLTYCAPMAGWSGSCSSTTNRGLPTLGHAPGVRRTQLELQSEAPPTLGTRDCLMTNSPRRLWRKQNLPHVAARISFRNR